MMMMIVVDDESSVRRHNTYIRNGFMCSASPMCSGLLIGENENKKREVNREVNYQKMCVRSMRSKRSEKKNF